MKILQCKTILLLAVIFSIFSSCAYSEELLFWNFWDPKFILPVIEEFEKQNPGVTIKNEQITWGNGLDKIVVAMANGKAPDICEMGSTWMGKFMGEGALIDVTEKFQDLKPEYMMWKPATWQGRLYGMPWLAGTRVLFYNRELFEKAGLDPDNPPATWQEFLDAAQKIHNPDEGTYGFGMNAGEGHILYKKFMPFVWGNGGKILDENGNFVFDSPQTREALNFYLELKKYSYREKQDLLDEAFKKGSLGMTISGSWNFARYPVDAPNLDFSVGLIPKPTKNKGYSASFLGGEILVLFKSCKNPDMAAKFVRFLVEAKNTLPITKEALVSFPAATDSFNDEFFTTDPRLQVFIEQMKTGVHPPVHPLWIELEKIINKAVESAMYGANIDEVFAQAEKEYQRVESRAKQNKSVRLKEQKQNREGNSVFSSSTQTMLLVLIAIGTIVNAILLSFLLLEVKKNAS
ncbi:MAG: extracellular solute-binding protein [Candidatus Rifleibacteriota bacterium]